MYLKIAMTRGFTSEATIAAIIESVITRSLAGQQEHSLNIGERHFPEGEEDNSMEVFEDVIELEELSQDLTALLRDLQAMEERLRASIFTRRRRGSRSLGVEGEGRRQRLEAGLERIRQRRLHRYVGTVNPQIFSRYMRSSQVLRSTDFQVSQGPRLNEIQYSNIL